MKILSKIILFPILSCITAIANASNVQIDGGVSAGTGTSPGGNIAYETDQNQDRNIVSPDPIKKNTNTELHNQNSTKDQTLELQNNSTGQTSTTSQ